MKKLFLRPNLILWGFGLIVAVIPWGKIITPEWICFQLFGLIVAVYNFILVIIFRNKYNMLD
jgi:hypothetical protein